MQTADFLVVGGGVVGLSIARELKARAPTARVVLLEKEPALGRHASGRNSGVLHAGFYYSSDSLKARLCRDGNRELREYCASRGIPVKACGKLVAARSEAEWPAMDELKRRARANGVELHDIPEAEARRLEPRVRTRGRALWSPATCSVDPLKVLEALARDAAAEGVELRLGCAYLGRQGRTIRTSQGTLEPGFLVNAAGLQADRVARDFGFGARYRMLPFKGLYLESAEPPGSFRTHIYPVPDLANPFLGVHVTVAGDGRAKIGPTAIPALWREQYGGLENFRLGELAEIAWRQLGLFLAAGFDFRRLALQEVLKQSRRRLAALAGELAEGVRLADYRRWGEPGIRAQLVDIRSKTLVMDFVLEGDERSLHVLNAVSPGFTCALPFARHAAGRVPGLG